MTVGKRISPDELAAFLVEAKRRTYAGSGNTATEVPPALPGSKQLEYRAGNHLYRDVYYGTRFFVGQETAFIDELEVWSMCYSGGVRQEFSDRREAADIYAFLRKALLAVASDSPFRGPPTLVDGDLEYAVEFAGNISRFHGVERIRRLDCEVYELRFSGGIVG